MQEILANVKNSPIFQVFRVCRISILGFPGYPGFPGIPDSFPGIPGFPDIIRGTVHRCSLCNTFNVFLNTNDNIIKILFHW